MEYESGTNWASTFKPSNTLTIYEQIEDPTAAKVRAPLATWREQTDT